MRRLLRVALISWPLLVLPLAHAHGEEAESAAPESGQRALVTIERQPGAATGLVEVNLPSKAEWRAGLFISLFQGEFHERKGIRRDARGRYRLEARLPPPGELNIYLRYGPGQAGSAGYARVLLPEEGGRVRASVHLDDGFARDVPAYVQPLGFLVFGAIAALTVLGLSVILQSIRASQGSAAR